MPRSRFPIRQFAALAVAGGLLACSSARPLSADPPVAVPAEAAVATRTTVSFGPGDVMVTEVVRIGDDARAAMRTLAGPFGEEILVGDDHYVRFAATEQLFGFDQWVHSDLSDPAQRAYVRDNPAGFIATADLVDTPVGGRVGRWEVLAVARPAPGVVVLDLDDGSVFTFRTELVAGAEPIARPDRSDVIDLVDLPGHLELPSFTDH